MDKAGDTGRIAVGEWVCVREDGLWCGIFHHNYSWNTKTELLQDISAAKLDAARKPMVKRIAKGRYEYIPKNCDTLRYQYGSSYLLVQLTNENIEEYRSMLARVEDD